MIFATIATRLFHARQTWSKPAKNLPENDLLKTHFNLILNALNTLFDLCSFCISHMQTLRLVVAN